MSFVNDWTGGPGHRRHHIVRPGETLSEIARRFGVEWRTLARANNIINPANLRVGARLEIVGRWRAKTVVKNEPPVLPAQAANTSIVWNPVGQGWATCPCSMRRVSVLARKIRPQGLFRRVSATLAEFHTAPISSRVQSGAVDRFKRS